MSVFNRLPEHLEARILRLLPPNVLACTIRLINNAASTKFKNHNIVRLSQLVPHESFAHRWGLGAPALRQLCLEKVRRLLQLTTASGSLENLQLALESTGCALSDPVQLMETAAAAGHLDICRWLRGRGLDLAPGLRAAAGAGRRDVCEWLLAQGCVPDLYAAADAAGGGHVVLMDWLLGMLPPVSIERHGCFNLIAKVAYGCDLATLKRLLISFSPGGLSEGEATGVGRRLQELRGSRLGGHIIGKAASSPCHDWREKLELLKVLITGMLLEPFLDVASLPEAVERFAALRALGCQLVLGGAAAAAAVGNLSALAHILGEVGLPVDAKRLASLAARHGQLPVLQFLAARGFPIEPRVAFLTAAAGRHLSVMVWLVEQYGGEAVAAVFPEVMERSGSSLEMLVWLRERGCQWHPRTLQNAAGGGSDATLTWLLEQGCPIGDAAAAYGNAIFMGNRATVRCLRRLGVPWDPGAPLSVGLLCDAPLAMLRWLVEEQSELKVVMDWEAAFEAVEGRFHDKQEVRDWLQRVYIWTT